MNSSARIAGIMGPQGGGKTTVIANRILMKAAMQPPSPIDGIARYRCIVWMRTYRELWAKVIPDWLEWIPKNDKAFQIKWTGGVDNPAEHSFMFEAVHKGKAHKVKCEVWFRAVGDQTPIEAAKGLHPTDAWLPEATSATVEMRKAMFGRLGRYPAVEHGGAPNRQMFCDWNAGDPYSWTTEYFITERPLGVDEDGRPMVEFFRQPGGRDAAAENTHNLPRNYYNDQIAANADDPDWIRRMVDNEIGFMRDGKPVYEDFSDKDHVSDAELVPWKGVPLIIAADGGLTPAAVIMQRNYLGEWQCLEEVVMARGGPEDFGELLKVRLDSPRYRGLPLTKEAYSDPATENALESSEKDTETNQLKSWQDIMKRVTKLIWKSSRCGNDLVIRTGSVTHMLKRRVQGRVAFRICRKHCPTLIKGLARDYKYEKVASVSQHGITYKEKPNKGTASHVCNALEYAAANGGEQDLVRGKETREQRLAKARAERERRGPPKPYDPLSSYRRRA
ncbi:hypothetical protein [uncultured Ruegeria sp.]|uniref:hypothetical protein n=1 Tax=uncultured Ruegeria sp. TaxID=259304 RepID=UPI00262A6F11|nr:hypothetical protein [uncultured Ruegeria sp.]